MLLVAVASRKLRPSAESASVTTVERHRAAAQAIRSNASHLGVSIDLRIADVRSVLAAGDWDVILMDPFGDDPMGGLQSSRSGAFLKW